MNNNNLDFFDEDNYTNPHYQFPHTFSPPPFTTMPSFDDDGSKPNTYEDIGTHSHVQEQEEQEEEEEEDGVSTDSDDMEVDKENVSPNLLRRSTRTKTSTTLAMKRTSTRKIRRRAPKVSSELHWEGRTTTEFADAMEQLRLKVVEQEPLNLGAREQLAYNLLLELYSGPIAQSTSLYVQSKPYMDEADRQVAALRKSTEYAAQARKRKQLVMKSAETVEGKVRFVCKMCVVPQGKQKSEVQVSYGSREGMVLHVRNAHEDDRPFRCPAPGCDVTYARRADFRNHLHQAHLEANQWLCCTPGCFKMFKNGNDLRSHLERKHIALVSALCDTSSPIVDDVETTW